MWKQDGATASDWIEAFQDVLEEGVISAPLWRGAQEIAPPWVSAPGLPVPLLD